MILSGALLASESFAATAPLLPFGFEPGDWEVSLASGSDPSVQLIPKAINVKVTPQKLGSKLYVYVGVRNENKASAWARVDLPLGTSEGEFPATASFPGGDSRSVSLQLRFAGGKVRGAIESSCDSKGLGLATPQAPSAGDYVFLRCKAGADGGVQVEVASLVAGSSVSGARWTDPVGTQDFGAIEAEQQTADGYTVIQVPAPAMDSGQREVEFSLGANTYRVRNQAPAQATASTPPSKKGARPASKSASSKKSDSAGNGLQLARFGLGGFFGTYSVVTDTTVTTLGQITGEFSYLPRYRFGLGSSLKMDLGLEATAALVNWEGSLFPAFQVGGNLGLAFAGGSFPVLIEAGVTSWSKDVTQPTLNYVGVQTGYENARGVFGLSFLKGLRFAFEKNLGSTENQRAWQTHGGVILGW